MGSKTSFNWIKVSILCLIGWVCPTFATSLTPQIDSAPEAADVLTIPVDDTMGGDALPLEVTEIRVIVSGSSVDSERANLVWRLNGNDVTNNIGSYDFDTNTVTFSGLSISVPNDTIENYVVSVYYSDNTQIVDNSAFNLRSDADVDFTIGPSGSPIGVTGGVADSFTSSVTATGLVSSADLSNVNVESGQGILGSTAIIITAEDDFGNVDHDYVETIQFTTSGVGTLRNSQTVADEGVATFTSLEYLALAENEGFDLQVDDISNITYDFTPINYTNLLSDIVATEMFFFQEPAPLEGLSGVPLTFTTQPIVHAVNEDNQIDTDFNGTVDFFRTSRFATSASITDESSIEISASGDTDASLAVVEVQAVNGVIAFTDLTIDFCFSAFEASVCNASETNVGAFSASPNDNSVDFEVSPILTFFGLEPDGDVTQATGVIEPVLIPSTAISQGQSVIVFDFTISDAGTDLREFEVTGINVDTSGTTIDLTQMRFFLNGPDVTNVEGTLSGGFLSFDGLTVSIDDGDSEVYEISTFFTDSSSLSQNQQLSLSLDAATGLTLGTARTSVANGSSTPVTNGGGSFVDVAASQLIFGIQPDGSESGVALTTQPEVMAVDQFGNIDLDFNEVITLSTTADGVLTNIVATAVNGVAQFSNLTYVPTVDQQSVTLIANDEDGVGSNLSTVAADPFNSNVTATSIQFAQTSSPRVVQSGIAEALTLSPIIHAVSDSGILDIDYNQSVSLFQSSVSDDGILTLEFSGVDLNSSGGVVVTNAVNGIADFSDIEITYVNEDASANEQFFFAVTSGTFPFIRSASFQSRGLNRDATLTSSANLVEPISLSSTVDTAIEAVNVFDFTLSDGGGGDGVDLEVEEINLQGSGSTLPLSQLTFHLNGPDVVDAVGVVVGDEIQFTDLSISVLDNASEVYDISVYFNDGTNLTENQSLLLSVDMSSDITVSTSSTLPIASSAPVTNGSGALLDVVATQLTYQVVPTGVVSGLAFGAQAIVSALDGSGNVDIDFVETITLTTSGPGSLIGDNSVQAVAGEATFTDVGYLATSDNEGFTLTAEDMPTDGLLPPIPTNLVSDVVATNLVFVQQIAPLSVNVGIDTNDPALPFIGIDNQFSSPPILMAQDANGLLDDDYNAEVTFVQGVINAGSVTRLTSSDDIDSDPATVTATASNGAVFLSDLIINYQSANDDDSVRIDVIDNDGNTLDTIGAVISDVNVQPVVIENTNSFGPIVAVEDIRLGIDTSDLEVQDLDNDPVRLELTVTEGLLFSADGDGTHDGVLISGSNGLAGSQLLSLDGTSAALTSFFDTNRIEYQTALNSSVPSILTLVANDGQLDGPSFVEVINVTGINDAPVISGTPDTNVNEGTEYLFLPSVADAENDTIIFNVVNAPSWASFDVNTGELRGTPANEDVGSTSNIIIEAFDGVNTVSLPAFTITVSNVEEAPVISGIPLTLISEDSFYSFTPVASDPDISDSLTFSIVNLPSWASFDTASGALTGTPSNEDEGMTVGIVISVTDGIFTVGLPSFNIQVTGVNDAPTISGVPASSVNQDTSFSFTPVATDVDSAGSLVFSIINPPSWANFNTSTGALSGTPSNNDVGITTNITISVSDGEFSASLTPFDLTVVNVNDAPVISGTPAFAVNQDTLYSFIPTATDVDIGTTLVFDIVNRPSWASFDVNTGILTGTPTNNDVGVYTGIIIGVSDGQLRTTLPPFNITVNDINDSPVINGIPNVTVDQDVEYVFIPSASDIDAGDTLLFSIANQPSWASFDASSGTLRGTPTNNDVAVYSGILISVNDGTETVSLPVFAITVNNINDAPQISGAPATNVNESIEYRFAPVASDIDVGDTLSFSATNIPSWATFDSSTGELIGTPANADVGVYAGITISVSDGNLSASLPTFNITVTDINEAPSITGTPISNVAQGQSLNFTPSASDPDLGETLTFSIVNQPSWATFDSNTGTLAGTPTNNDVGIVTGIVISVSDGELTDSLPSFDLTVTNVNDAPEISGVPQTFVTDGATYRFIPTVNDIDVGSTLSFSINTLPSWATFDLATGELFGIPGNADIGTVSNIVITVSDGELTASLPPFNIVVSDVNEPPVISGVPSSSVNQDDVFIFTPISSDPDLGTTLLFSIINQPLWAIFDASTGTLSGTPTNEDIGTTDNIEISVTDGEFSASLPPFSLSVLNVNDAPVISGTPLLQTNDGIVYRFTPTAIDVDADAVLSFSVTNPPSWATFNVSTGELTGTPTNADISLFSNIVISVSDGELASSLPAFNIQVINVNDAPIISGIPATSVAQDAVYLFVPVASDPDVVSTLTYSISNQPTWAIFDVATGTLSGTPTTSDIGQTENIVISVSDGELSASLPAFTLTVGDVNDAPTITGIPNLVINEDEAYSFIPSATDPDIDTTLVFSIENLPSWATFDSNTGSVSGVPENEDVGIATNIIISVTDGELSASLAPFNIEVVAVNDEPIIEGTPSTVVIVDESYSFTPTANDEETLSGLTFAIQNMPSWAAFEPSTGELTGIPVEEDIGTFSNIIISVSDGELTSALSAFSIEVIASNRAPVITGTPRVSVNEGQSYSFTPTSSDPDEDELTFSIQNMPSWASFSEVSGRLSGTPRNTDIGVTRNVTIQVSDGELTTNLSPFDIEVVEVNDPPTAANIEVQVNQNSSIEITPLIDDEDSDNVQVQIESEVQNGLLTLTNNSFTYTPNLDFVGSDSFTYSANDGENSSAPATVLIDVVAEPVLDAIDDSFIFDQNSTGVYLLDVLANDIGIEDDDIRIEGAQSQFGLVEIEDNILILTIAANFVGQVDLSYSLVNEQQERDLANVVVTINQGLEADGPIISVPDDLVVDATGLLTRVELGVATAVDNETNLPVPVALVESNVMFTPGKHSVVWSAIDEAGRESFATQVVEVKPLVSTSFDEIVFEGDTAIMRVFLNGESPEYPVIIPFTVSGSATTGVDFILENNAVVIEQGISAEIEIPIVADDDTEGSESVVLTLDESINTGVNRSTRLTIEELNNPPVLRLDVFQDNQKRLLVSQNEGTVRVEANISEVNADVVQLEWNTLNTLADINPEENVFEFDPSNVEPGAYLIRAIARNTGESSLSTSTNVILELRENVVSLSSGDSDGDLISDIDEGIGDQDEDGIPDFQDTIDACNVIPAQVTNQMTFLAEGEPGVCIRRGLTSTVGELGGIQLTDQEAERMLGQDVEAENIGGIFDFVVNGLPVNGETYRLVLPQQNPVPIDAVYRKFVDGQWVNFVEDEFNHLSSAAGSRGVCPPPGNDSYQSGLIEGHWCVQLEIQDGGPNDDDGSDDGSILDPGGVATLNNVNSLPIARNDIVTVPVNVETQLNVLENDQDADEDVIQIISATANIGQVSIADDGQSLLYVATDEFIGTDLISYGISDENGGTASADVQVQVVVNVAPIANDDLSTTNHLTSIEIDVLANDTDSDNDTLWIVSAAVDVGQVEISDEQTLIYIPEVEFDGNAMILYTVTDGVNESLGVALVSVQGNRPPIANNDSTVTRVGSSVTVDVLSNDIDEDSDVLSVVDVSPINGQVVINNDNTLTFTPDVSFTGEKQIVYVIADEFGATAQGTVVVSVLAEEPNSTDNSSSGGSSSSIWLWLLVMSALLKRYAVVSHLSIHKRGK